MRKLVPYTMPDGSRPASRLPVILSAVLAVAVVALLALNVYQYAAGAELRKQVYDLEAQMPAPQMLAPLAAGPDDSATFKAVDAVLNNYAPSIEYILMLEDVMNSNSYVVPNDGTMLYHRYGCPYFDYSIEFYIFNRNYAESHGYLPCSKCVGHDTAVFSNIMYHYSSIRDLLDLIHYGTESDWTALGASLQSSNTQGA